MFFTAIAAHAGDDDGLGAGLSRPSERRGFLPMTTTRGDRLFIGLLGAAWIHLGWLGLSDLPLWRARSWR